MITKTQNLASYLEEISSQGRTMLLPALHYGQEIHGWLPKEVQVEISNALRVPLADIHGVIEFYTLFYNQPTAKKSCSPLRWARLPISQRSSSYEIH